MQGWVKLHRKMVDWQWWSSLNHRVLFIELLMRANHKQTKWRKETIEPGQLLTGRVQLSEWTGLSQSTIYRTLLDLQDSGELNIKKTNKYSIITITNWSKYQLAEQQMNNKRTTNEQQVDTSKNVKNVKKNKGTKNTYSEKLISLFDDADLIEWLKKGNNIKQQSFLIETYNHDFLRKEIRKAYLWQIENKKRKSGVFLTQWVERSNDSEKFSKEAIESEINSILTNMEKYEN